MLHLNILACVLAVQFCYGKSDTVECTKNDLSVLVKITSQKRPQRPCGGALITLEWSVTSARCMVHILEGVSRAMVHAGYKHNESVPEQNRRVSRYVFHENFKEGITTGPSPYDVGLVKVNTPFAKSGLVNVAKLPLRGQSESECKNLRTVNINKDLSLPSTICKETRLVENFVCMSIWMYSMFTEEMLCGQHDPAKEECTSTDYSGRPLICKGTIVGIENNCQGSENTSANVLVTYSNVKKYVDFIRNTTEPKQKISQVKSQVKLEVKNKNSTSTGTFFHVGNVWTKMLFALICRVSSMRLYLKL